MSAEKLGRQIRESAGKIRKQCDEMKEALQRMRSRCMKAEEVREHANAVMLLCGILAECNMIDGCASGGEMSGLVERPLKVADLELHRGNERAVAQADDLPLPGLLVLESEVEAREFSRARVAPVGLGGCADDTLTTDLTGGTEA